MVPVMDIEATFSWPDKKLLPNARVHWAEKARLIKAYRQSCFYATRVQVPVSFAAEARLRVETGEKIHLFIDFIPPDRRARDDDGAIGAFKAGRDGIADALGVDDKHFRIHPFLNTDPTKGGMVAVRFSFGPMDGEGA